jgi:putative ABC transport system permease protein
MKSQALAIALVIICGIGTYIMFLTTLSSLRATQDNYYRNYRFAEVFVTLKRAPESLRQRIQAIDGVNQIETRVVAQARLDMPGFTEPVTALMVSVSDSGRDGLNAQHLRQGRLPMPERPDEVAVSAPFA